MIDKDQIPTPHIRLTPEKLNALYQEASRTRHARKVRRRRAVTVPLSLAASVALLLGVGGTLYRQLTIDQPGALVAENVMEPTIWDDGLMFSESRPIESRPVRAKARPRPATAVSATAPEAAPQDISAPLPAEEINMETQPIYCNSSCDEVLLACDFDDYLNYITTVQMS